VNRDTSALQCASRTITLTAHTHTHDGRTRTRAWPPAHVSRWGAIACGALCRRRLFPPTRPPPLTIPPPLRCRCPQWWCSPSWMHRSEPLLNVMLEDLRNTRRLLCGLFTMWRPRWYW
jgi:hypothetical protein